MQCDPISPLQFVLVMKYLSRMLKRVSMLPDFKFHPMCKSLKLTHLLFADDLTILCKGNDSSVNRIMEALTHFSNVTGLIANIDKSSIFMAKVDDNTKEQLLDRKGLALGTLPIKYLGLPMPQRNGTILIVICWQRRTHKGSESHIPSSFHMLAGYKSLMQSCSIFITSGAQCSSYLKVFSKK